MYGHGDVIRGQDASWTCGQGPWTLAADGDRLYGRGSADNKGQHSINIAALAQVLAGRGRLGFNVKWLIETGEETGSPGLAEFCRAQAQALAADVLIASDGPRLARERPTVFLGSRGVVNFDLELVLREGGHHSGNWGGLLRNPGTVLANAIACLVDGRGVIRVPALRPPPIPANVRARSRGWHSAATPATRRSTRLGRARPDAGRTRDRLEHAGGAGLSHRQPRPPGQCDPACGQGHDAHALRGRHRCLPGTRGGAGAPGRARLRRRAGRRTGDHGGDALDPDNPWVRFTLASLERSTGKRPVLLPNLGGSLPNDVFAEGLGLPTVWVPHSYAACQQHAPDEHLLAPVAREALQMMTGLFWDLGEAAASLPRRPGS
jgi:hypothetical protein